MKIEIALKNVPPEGARVGNVYAVKGGRGMSSGHMNVLIAMTPKHEFNGISCLMLTVNKAGEPVGVTRYGLHYVQELCPIAIVEGLDKLKLIMKSLK